MDRVCHQPPGYRLAVFGAFLHHLNLPSFIPRVLTGTDLSPAERVFICDWDRLSNHRTAEVPFVAVEMLLCTPDLFLHGPIRLVDGNIRVSAGPGI